MEKIVEMACKSDAMKFYLCATDCSGKDNALQVTQSLCQRAGLHKLQNYNTRLALHDIIELKKNKKQIFEL